MEFFKPTTGMLSRRDMEAVIKSGGSVSVAGNILTKIDHLPSEAQLAETPDEKDQVLQSLKDQMDALQAEIRLLTTDRMVRAPEIDLSKPFVDPVTHEAQLKKPEEPKKPLEASKPTPTPTPTPATPVVAPANPPVATEKK